MAADIVAAGSPSIRAAASGADAAGPASTRAPFEERRRRVDIHLIRAVVRTRGVAR